MKNCGNHIEEEVNTDELPCFSIKLINSPLEFFTRNPEDNFRNYDCDFTTFTPSYKNNGYQPEEGWFENIHQVYDLFDKWLDEQVKPYIEEEKGIDLWEVMFQEESKFDWQNIFAGDNDYFTPIERNLVSQKLIEFKGNIIERYSPNYPQLALIEEKLDYLTEALDRLNKYDWKSIFISTLIGILTTLSLDKQTGDGLFEMARHLFSKGILMLN